MYSIYMWKNSKLMGEIKALRRERFGPLKIVKMSIISNLSYKFNKIHIKPPKFYFVDFNELILKFM